MKKLLVLVLAVFMIYGCKAKQSKVSSLVEQAGKVYYLFGTSSGEDGTSLVCRYTCAAEPKQETKRSLCSSPLYIKKEVIQSSNLSNFLKYIEDSSRVFMRKQFDQSTDNRLATLFYQAEEEKEVYDTSIGDPDKVCDNVLDSGNGGILVSSGVRRIPVDSDPPTGEIVEISSIKNKIKLGYPTLVVYGCNGCGAYKKENDYLISKKNQLKGRMYVYYVNIDNKSFEGDKDPCGTGAYPQNQFFDESKQLTNCSTGFDDRTISKIEKSLGSDINPGTGINVDRDSGQHSSVY